ncbi:hypothetical protein ACH5RR_025455 [Cinchona calisaya]|uniref:Protein NBR1 homolog n=1 Tax=Cinchona calisaya TaxID=153742 RepID=A0ABD2Z0T2_9GENT
MESTIVVKVKHEETLRRFNARLVDGKLDLNMDALREKIIGLFKFTPDAELTLTYVDEDSDIVTLAEDEDLQDVVRQALNPLRITVKLSNGKNGRFSARTSGSSTPLRSPRVQQPSLNLSSNVLLKSVPEPIGRAITKIYTDLASTSTPSGQTLTDLVQCLSGMGLPYLNQLADLQTGGANTSVQGEGPGCTKVVNVVTASQDAEGSKADAAASDAFSSVGSENPSSKNEVLLNSESKRSESKIANDISVNTDGGVKALGHFPGLEAVQAALDGTVQIDTRKKKEVDCQSGEHLSSGKFVNLSSLSDPRASNTATADNKEASYKPNESTGTKSINAHAFPSYPANAMWSNLNSQIRDSVSGEMNPFKSGLWNSSGINLVPSPFTIGPLGNSPAVTPPQVQPNIVQPRKNHGFFDSPGIAFHRGVRCDGCGVHPITGSRFKSKVKDDYDLCRICFNQIGNENDYIRIDRPLAYRHPYSFKGLYDFHNRMRPSSQPPVLNIGGVTGVKPGRPKLDARFIYDVNVLDGTIMAPSTPFTKIWRMRNNGSVAWPQGTQLVWIGGDQLSETFSVQLEIASVGISVDQEHDVAVDFLAPDRPGRYISYWRMASPSGQKFGQRVWVLIQVDAKELPHEGFCGFNLNLPPVSNGISGPEIIYVNPEPVVEDSLPEVDNSNEAMKLVEPMLPSPEKEQDVNFPINDTLLVGGGAVSSPVPATPFSSASYPITDLSGVAPMLPTPLPSPATFVPTSVQDVKEAAHGDDSLLKYVKEQEEALLKDLEDMGFKQVDLNKEILRQNEYDLEKSVDDLCGVEGWDHLLEELNEMGFSDKTTNQKLLKKNNGSIKRVVLDLLAIEE